MTNGVYLASSTNSTKFTSCCRVAIADSQKNCPECDEPVVGHNAKDEHERRQIRWKYAYN